MKLALPGNGNAPAREIPMADRAGRQLAFWLRIRAQIHLPGEFVFPSTMAGTQWSATRCFEGCHDVLNGARVANDNGRLFELRHTVARRQLRKGKSEEAMAKWLGFLDVNSIVRYRRIITSYQDVVRCEFIRITGTRTI